MKYLEDRFGSWGDQSWVGSYAGTEALRPDPSTARLTRTRETPDGIHVDVRDLGGQSYSTVLLIEDEVNRSQVATLLDGAIGSTLEEVGSLALSSEDQHE